MGENRIPREFERVFDMRVFWFVVIVAVGVVGSIFLGTIGPLSWPIASKTAVQQSTSPTLSPALSNAGPLIPTFYGLSHVPLQADRRQCDGNPPVAARQTAQPQPAERIGGRNQYINLIRNRAKESGLPVDIADAVAYVESGYHPEKIGGVGEIGLMQVRPSTAFMLGFRGSDLELAAPEINVQYGVNYLARAWRLANADLCRALMKYRAGHGEERMSARSVEYCDRANAYLKSINSSFAMNLSSPRPAGSASIVSDKARAVGAHSSSAAAHSKVPRDSNRFWSAHEARIRQLTKRVHAKWRSMAASRKLSSL
jgi:hypothetical protein